MDKCPERTKLSKLTHEKGENINNPIKGKGNGLVIKKLPTQGWQNGSMQMSSLMICTTYLKRI
jgi:hypothetical protein